MSVSEALTGILAIVFTAVLVALRRVLRRRRPAPPPALTTPQPRASRPSFPPRRVLVVDDERAMATGIARLLVGALPGVDVEHAQSGEEAIAMVRAAPVDVFIVDVGLRGGMSGPEVVRRLREEGHVFRVIVISAIEEDDLARIAEGLDARWWAKSKDVDALIEVVRDLLR